MAPPSKLAKTASKAGSPVTPQRKAAAAAPAGLSLQKSPGAVLTLGQRARKEQEAGLAKFEAFLASGDPSAEQAEEAVGFVAALEQQKFGFGMAEDLKQGGLFLVAYTSLKFPQDQKTEEVDSLVNQLKGDDVPTAVYEALLRKEAYFFSRLFPAGQLGAFVKALVTVCNAANPKSADLHTILDLLGPTIRALLSLPAPVKYLKQKAHTWQSDLSKAIAVGMAATRGTYGHLLFAEQEVLEEVPAGEDAGDEEDEEDKGQEDLGSAVGVTEAEPVGEGAGEEEDEEDEVEEDLDLGLALAS